VDRSDGHGSGAEKAAAMMIDFFGQDTPHQVSDAARRDAIPSCS
jgi:hypothetical protein